MLALLSVGGVAQGLFLSALANRNKDIANLLLPLLMIGQILFSAQVVGDPGTLDFAYKSFRFQPEPPAKHEPWYKLAAPTVSYLMLSRYGDILLRSFAHPGHLPKDAEHFNYALWRREALTVLGCFPVLLLLATAACLRRQAWSSRYY